MALLLWCTRPDLLLEPSHEEEVEEDVVSLFRCRGSTHPTVGLFSDLGPVDPQKRNVSSSSDAATKTKLVCEECGYTTTVQLTLDFHIIASHSK
jgi:hypothetical protein